MEIKPLLGRMVPLIIGILIGAGLTKNKYVSGIIISYIIFVIGMSLLAKKITKVKKADDKKQALKDAAVEGVDDFISATEKGNLRGASWFDRNYPNYVFYLNMTLLFSMIYLAIAKEWLWVVVCFLGINVFVILNQVWRKVKYLDTKEYDDFIKGKIFKQKQDQLIEKRLKKMGVTKNG